MASKWVQQVDSSSCGPLTVAAAASWLQGRVPSSSWMGDDSIKPDRARLLRSSQLLDLLAMVMRERGISFSATASDITDPELRSAIETAERRVLALCRD